MHSSVKKILRAATNSLFRACARYSRKVLRYYPHVVPDDEIMAQWQRSEWPEYQNWLNRHSILTRAQWLLRHKQATDQAHPASVTVVVPVFNTEPDILAECILSVRIQTSPYWELILVDDGSTNPGTLATLKSRICRDPRIRILPADTSSASGISAASNRGIQAATGDYIIFLDHDDRLAPEAIHAVQIALAEDRKRDIIYSDRDMISPGGKRVMHLMKPDWSPDNLYAGNYIFHLMCYRRALIDKVGGLRSEYNGSQDYDLILRCMEHTSRVHHIPEVLYHWRQHSQSVALDDDAKDYAFDAGMAALRDALKRRNIRGATVSENKSLWRGNYQVRIPPPPTDEIGFVILREDLHPEDYVKTVTSHPVLRNPPPYIFIRQEGCVAEHEDTPGILASWLAQEQVGMVSGRLLSQDGKIIYAGMSYDALGNLFAPYSGFDSEEPGYMAVTQNLRNISVPMPFCVMIRRELWRQAGGFSSKFTGPPALLDLALRALETQWRILYVPDAVFTCSALPESCHPPWQEQDIFRREWRKQLEAGDPYYSPNLRLNSTNYELA